MAAPLHALRSRLQRLAIGPRLAAVQLLVCDVDGVLTDGGLHYDEAGAVVKRFDVRDGLAIRLLQQAGLEVALLSGGRSGAVEHRARHLQIRHCRVGVGDKLTGLRVAPADAARGLRRRADWVLRQRGGHGAVRELAEAPLQARDALQALHRQGWRDGNG